MNSIAIIDFETTGLSPAMGDRATEVAIVMMEGGRIVDRFQSLMNAGVRISAFIEAYTGISNAMIATAPPAAAVMADAARFVGNAPMVAHNASFDQRFWCAELARAGVAAALLEKICRDLKGRYGLGALRHQWLTCNAAPSTS